MDTRNLAIVFGPTVVRSGDDVMSLVTDMSDQCRIIESLIVYCEWMFSPFDSEPPALDEAEISSSCAPISETMNNMSADLADLAAGNSKCAMPSTGIVCYSLANVWRELEKQLKMTSFLCLLTFQYL